MSKKDIVCPSCGSHNTKYSKGQFVRDAQSYECVDCNRKFHKMIRRGRSKDKKQDNPNDPLLGFQVYRVTLWYKGTMPPFDGKMHEVVAMAYSERLAVIRAFEVAEVEKWDRSDPLEVRAISLIRNPWALKQIELKQLFVGVLEKPPERPMVH